MRKFEPEMTVREALELHPKARWVFAAWQLGGCNQCSMVDEETLAQVAAGYKLPLERLMSDLNALLETYDGLQPVGSG